MLTHDAIFHDGIVYLPSDTLYQMAGYLTYTIDNPQKANSFLSQYYLVWLEQEPPTEFSMHWQDYYLPLSDFIQIYGDQYYYGYYRGSQYAIAIGTFDAHFSNPLRNFSFYDEGIPYFKGYAAGFEMSYRMAFEAHLYRNRFLLDN